MEVTVAFIQPLAGSLILFVTVLILRAVWATDTGPTAPARARRVRISRVSDLVEPAHRKAA